jgi:hypothetical protein
MVLEPIETIRVATVVNARPARAWEIFTGRMLGNSDPRL